MSKSRTVLSHTKRAEVLVKG